MSVTDKEYKDYKEFKEFQAWKKEKSEPKDQHPVRSTIIAILIIITPLIIFVIVHALDTDNKDSNSTNTNTIQTIGTYEYQINYGVEYDYAQVTYYIILTTNGVYNIGTYLASCANNESELFNFNKTFTYTITNNQFQSTSGAKLSGVFTNSGDLFIDSIEYATNCIFTKVG